MKKIISLLLIILTFISVLTPTLSAELNYKDQEITVGKATPTVDGYIDLSEGWSNPAYLNTLSMSTCWNTAPQTVEGMSYYAYDENGIYFSADIIEGIYGEFLDGRSDGDVNTFTYSTGSDEDAGFNGDVFIFALDIDSKLYESGMNNPNRSYSPWYCVGLFEDGARMTRAELRNYNGDITDKVQVEAQVTEKGWMLEAFLPWDMVIEDIFHASKEKVSLDRESLTKGGYTITSDVIYMDRFYDPESEEVDTWSRYATVAAYLPDGTPGSSSSGVTIPCYAIDLVMTDHTFISKVTEEAGVYDAGTVEMYCTTCNEVIKSYNKPVNNNVGELDDVIADKWFSESIRYCLKHGYMDGVGYRRFDADGVLTREMFAQILFNLSDDSPYDFENDHFTDVIDEAWYEDAVAWAYGVGVVSGISETEFGVGRAITRQEMVTMLYNFSVYREYSMDAEADLTVFSDNNTVAPWAEKAMTWAIDRKVVSGTSPDTLSPRKTAQRMEVACIIERYADNVVAVEINKVVPAYIEE